MTTPAQRVAHRYDMPIPHAREAVFPLLCPVLEREWIDGWECELVHSESGVAELGCVFTTELPGRGPETWVVTRYEPHERIDFCRVAGSTRACHLTVALDDDGEGGTTLRWTYAHTGLDDEGRDWVADYGHERFASEMKTMRTRLVHHLATGEMLVAAPA